ncbi:hypothetical protein IWQ47_001591 [Aquimarina sp. EL_43]|uniref:hypothetical protein n=1 Tax=Aquimarina TaxID=290174 RepID=UPI000470E749|nr:MULTISPECIES: hypothetical protein [Aquimarina]MBG6130326.1 hypothetical protein [Aquimarina sp. EL_35]MBG6149106.1 hypothetical protein [Aquimarina sp. EL_32]MBG6168520.1 hypothetical protein [Aquimarina sp. EL_43]
MSTIIKHYENKLNEAKARLKKASIAVSTKNTGIEWPEFDEASKNLLICERQLAVSKNEEYADVIDFPVAWDVGAPLPHVFLNDHKAYLLFYVKSVDPNWDGTYTTIVDTASDKVTSLALVEFEHCTSAKLGSPNDEVFEGHPLYGKGLEFYAPLQIINSNWIKEIKKINSIHTNHNADNWKSAKHFFFGFHDSTFECIADSFKVELHQTSFKSLMRIVCQKLVN